MGVCYSRETIVTVPDKAVMLNIVDRIITLEEKIKKGEHLTRVQELEKSELEKVAKSMKAVQKASMSRVGDLTHDRGHTPYNPEE
tara:strand:- start:13321 stop:13575 length:255 start_codon:yes stop_codon:yes gene_type:complete